ncbi:bifunctional RNase H/acid phosphatase [Catellatospora methionotrophica]|uniref:Bifunctional RNase H/acid phosphatase n=1 Tax=Catellatospora methionotrophica TaxID=121620 RepID=A0A8J3LAV2_9ACTN|nr:bifunctional RNase H/acid phosphatase [Catellatospora methionotrophica]GIG15622.1 bifunctional RNase H/acid phosphatase [Catellatospora methionotrophica]
MTIGKVIIEADGGARGNPGPAGYGAVVRDPASGEVLAERAAALGVTTNNVAEYRGLIAGLEAAAELGASQVEARMDSKLVVEQMSGRWQIKHPGLRPLAAEVATLVRKFEQVTYTWIPRERNRAADALANAAMDAAAGKGGSAAGKLDGETAFGIVTAWDADAFPIVPDGDAATGSAASRTATSGGLDSRAGTASGRAAGGTATARPREDWAPRTAPATRLVLVRHGETEMTAQKRYSGRGDVPLSAVGEEQAAAAGRRVAGLRPDRVVSSPLSRCKATAAAIAAAAGGIPVGVENDLIECDFGVWEAMTFGDVREQYPAELDAWLASTSVAPPKGESFQQVAKRVRGAMGKLQKAYEGQTVVIVSHVSPIKLILRDALAAGDAFLYRLLLDPAGVSIVDVWPDGGVSVRSVNDTAHLQPNL